MVVAAMSANAELALIFVLGIVFAGLAYASTNAFRRRTGRNPWGIPPLVWLVLGFFFGVFGTLLSLLACATSRARSLGPPGGYGPGNTPYGGAGPYRGPGPYGTGPYGGAGPYGGPGQNPSSGPSPTSGPYGPARPYGTPPPGHDQPGPAGPPPGWYDDPASLHQFRYWSGTEWTEHVSDYGAVSEDPLPPPPVSG